jgi:hypothetical protein
VPASFSPEELDRSVGLEPRQPGIGCEAVVDRGREGPAVRAHVDRIVGIKGSGRHGRHEVDRREGLGRPCLERLPGQRGRAEEIDLGREPKIAEGASAGREGSRHDIDVRMGQDYRETARPPAHVDDAGQNERLRQDVRGCVGNAELGPAHDRGDALRATDIVEGHPAVDRGVKVVPRLAGPCSRSEKSGHDGQNRRPANDG